MLDAREHGMDDGSNTGAPLRWVAIIGLMGVGAVSVLWFRADTEDDAAAPEAGPSTPAVAAGPTPRLPAPTVDAPEPQADDDIPLATQPVEGATLALVDGPVVCDVTPATAGPPVQGSMKPRTWPGPDHTPREGGVDGPVIPTKVSIEAGVLTGKLFLQVDTAGTTPVRHVSRLTVPGFAPTDFSFVTSGPGAPVVCDGPIQLELAQNGVVGTVRTDDGSPAEGAIVSGCKARAVAGSDGDYFLLPRTEEPCALRARHAPGSAAQTPPRTIDPLDPDDHVVDFDVARPETPDAGVRITRDEAGEVWLKAEGPDAPWDKHVRYGTVLKRVGDVAANSLSDAELMRALVQLDQPLHLQLQLRTADGQVVYKGFVVDEL
jgi:hypothetical protein